jgi:hypothetical protein
VKILDPTRSRTQTPLGRIIIIIVIYVVIVIFVLHHHHPGVKSTAQDVCIVPYKSTFYLQADYVTALLAPDVSGNWSTRFQSRLETISR